jgi:hypothetical protein
MSKNTRQPGAYDAVLGGIAPDLSSVAVLGGIDAVQLHLQSDSLSIKLAALNKALNYGEAGLELVINALDDRDLRSRAFDKLRERKRFVVKDHDYVILVHEHGNLIKVWNIKTEQTFSFYNPEKVVYVSMLRDILCVRSKKTFRWRRLIDVGLPITCLRTVIT